MKTTVSHHRISFIVVIFAVMMTAVFGLLAVLATKAWLPEPPATDVSGTINVDTTWTLAGSPYILTDTLTVGTGVTLTIEPGVVVMGQSSTSLVVNGRLQAIGTETQPITFTSAADTGAGEWYGIDFDGGDGRLEHVVVRYAGQHGSNGIFITGQPTDGPVAITNSVIADNLGHPITIFTDDLHRLQLSDVTFSVNEINRVFIGDGTGNYTLADDVTLSGQPGLDGYEVSDLYGLTVPAGVTMTLQAGATIMVSGTLICPIMIDTLGHLETTGTVDAPVTFTSVSDSNPGEWTGICVMGSAHLDHTHFRNGQLNMNIWGGLGGPVLIENSVISDSSHYGMSVGAEALPRFQMSNVTFNGANRRILLDNYLFLVDDAVLSNQSGLEGYEVRSLNFPVPEPKLVVPPGVMLTMEAGTTLMSPINGRIVVSGHLEAMGTAVSPVTFTSITDTAPSEWYGLVVSGTADLQHTYIRNGQDNLTLQGSGDVQLIKSEISQAGVNGLNVFGGRVTAVCTTFSNNTDNAIYVDGSAAPDVTVFSSSLSGNGNGVNNASGTAVDTRYNWWGDPTGPGGDGPGSGDTVLGNVLYDPWLSEPICMLFDLEATQAAATDPILAGETLTYTAVITNHGVEAATAVTLTVQHSANATFVSSDFGVCTGTTTVNCAIGAIPAGTSMAVTYTLQLDVAATGIVTSVISVTAAESELILSNNAAAVETAVAPLPAVGFSQTGYSVYENALTTTITVTLDVAPVFTVTVAYDVVGGTAVAGTDYMLAPGTLTFPPGTMMQTILIAILDDSVLDGPVTLDLQLSQQAKASLAQDSAELIILDNEMRYQQFLPFVVQ